MSRSPDGLALHPVFFRLHMTQPARPLPGIVHFVCLAALAAVTFGRAVLEAEFLNFDDNLFFATDAPWSDGGETQNAFAQLWNIWTQPYVDAYLPVFHTSLWFDRVVFGYQNPFGSHVHNLALHVVAAYVLARLVARLGASAARSTMVAACFLVHPALVESVVWVSSRKDLLSGLLVFVALEAVARFAIRTDRRRAMVTVAVVAAVGALYAKGTAIVLPLLCVVVVKMAFVALDRQLEGRGSDPAGLLARAPRSSIRALVGALFVVAFLAGLHHTLVARGAGTFAATDTTVVQRAMQVPGVYLHYLKTTVCPVGLDVLYPEVKTMAAFRSVFVLGLVAVAMVFGGAFLCRDVPRLRRLWFGVALWGLALLPFNTCFPALSIAAADRYLYLAVPGFAYALMTIRGRFVPIFGLVVITLFTFGAFDRARDFESSESLWSASLERDPENAVAHLNLVEATRRTAKSSDLERHLEMAARVARYPQHRLRANQQLGWHYFGQNNLDRALEAFGKTADVAEQLVASDERLDNLVLQSLLTAATVAATARDEGKAAEFIGRARARAPEHPAVLAYDATLLLEQALAEGGGDYRVGAGDPRRGRAERLVQRGLGHPLASLSYEIQFAAGRWAAATGKRLDAIRHFEAAIALQPGLPDPYTALTNLYVSNATTSGDSSLMQAALATIKRGIEATGKRDPQLLHYYAIVLSAVGKQGDAIRYFEDYLELRPDDMAARKTLSELLAAEAMQGIGTLGPAELGKLGVRIRQLDPNNPKGIFVHGVARRYARDFEGALVLMERAGELLPDRPDIQRAVTETTRDLAWWLLRSGRADEAYFEMRRFLDRAALEPSEFETGAVENALRTHVDSLAGNATEAYQRGDAQRALDIAHRVFTLDPSRGELRLLEGGALQVLGRDHEALTAFEGAQAWAVANERDPSLPVLLQLVMLQRLDRAGDAVRRGRKFLDEIPSTADRGTIDRIEALLTELQGR